MTRRNGVSEDPPATEPERRQLRVEFAKAAGPVIVGVCCGIVLAAVSWHCGPWHLVKADAVAQIIPVLIVAVILESSFTNLPRRTKWFSRWSYRLSFAGLVALLLVGEASAVVNPNQEQEWRLLVQLAALAAGAITVSLGFFFNLLGSRFPLEISISFLSSREAVVCVGGSNRFRATEMRPLLNVMVPQFNELIDESNTTGEIIGDRKNFPLFTDETIDGIKHWRYTAREFGASAGDNRVGFFLVKRGEETDDDGILKVVARADHQDLKQGREEAKASFEWPVDGGTSAEAVPPGSAANSPS